MFGKSVWSITSLVSGEDAKVAFEKFVSNQENLDLINPTLLVEDKLNGAPEAVGLTAYHSPLKVQDGDPLKNCWLTPDVVGLWFVKLELSDIIEGKVLQESASYESYHMPFRFLPKEQKQDVVDQLAQEEQEVIIQKHVPVIIDFASNKIWVSSSKKQVLEELRVFLADTFEIETTSLWLDFGNPEWPHMLLDKIQAGTLYLDEFEARAEEVAKQEDPKLVEPHENPVVEKILKKYFRCLEHDGQYLFLGSPAKLSLTNHTSTISTQTPWDSVCVLQHGLGISSARLVVAEGTDKGMWNQFAIDVSENFHQEPGFVVLKGLESFELHSALKETGTAKGKLELQDYWITDYQCNQVALAKFIEIVKGLLELNGGLSTSEQSGTTKVID